MQSFAKKLQALGHQVIYIHLNDPNNLHCFDKNISTIISNYQITTFEYLQPDEYRVDEHLKQFCAKLSIESYVFDTEHFYSSRSELSELFAGKKTYLMETFYRYMRKKHKVLLIEAAKDPATRQIASLMLPALLGVGVAQISLLINTQIASHLAPGSVSWLTYADRLMEFPTAILGVALGAVLMPQLAAAKAKGDQNEYAAMLDWGLRLVVVLALPCAAALLTFSQPLVSVLYHYGAFTDKDVQQTTLALSGYGVGLLGLVAIKVLAPGYYASQDIKTPVKIAIVVLCFTQLMNLALVPYLAHAGLALSIGLGALLNAGWLLIGLLRKGVYKPQPGWLKFGLKVISATLLLALFLILISQKFDWLLMRQQAGMRLGLMFLVLASSALIFFGTLRLSGLRLQTFLRP
jgi:putative peptidoglycan lipid II flippase